MLSMDELKTLIDYHDDLYYNHDNPELSDEEYDELKMSYLRRRLMGEDIVPGEVSSKFAKVNHLYGIKSLGKINTDSEVSAIIDKFDCGDVTIKLDGLTIVVYGKGTYSDTEDVWATRGNGIEGENVSHTCAKVPGLKAIPNLTYRCEVYMPLSEFKRINQERVAQGLTAFKNPRNAAAGMIRNTDASKVQGLRYMAYEILGVDACHTDQIEMLKLHGIQTVPYVKFDSSNKDKAVSFVTTYADLYRDKLDMEIDGLVIKSDEYASLKKYGETGHHPNNAVAYKFTSQGAWSVLNDVLWQVGRTGQISPVAVFDGVDILGSTVSRATLHNMKYIDAMDLRIGSSIYVIKANDVIPRVAKASNTGRHTSKILHPIFCPVCRADLNNVNDTLFCTNNNCDAKIVAQVAHMCGKEALNIEGLSTKTIQKFFDLGMLNTRYDILKLKYKDIVGVSGFADSSASTLAKNIEKSISSVPFEKFLYASGIPLLGRHASRDIAENFSDVGSIRRDLLNGGHKLRAIPGIGESLISNISSNFDLIDDLIEVDHLYVDYTKKAKTFNNPNALNFVITGTLKHGTRDYYKSEINARGHHLHGSVTKKTNYLVTNETTQTTKLIKAQSLGVPVITEDELIAML